jgi:hypothetical protein
MEALVVGAVAAGSFGTALLFQRALLEIWFMAIGYRGGPKT